MTVVDLYNRALDIIGTQTVQATGEATNEGRVCDRNYANCRKAVLRMHPWNFAIERNNTSLPMSTTTNNPDYTNRFTLPSDFLRFLEIVDEDRPEYALEAGGYLYSNSSTMFIKYVADIEQVDLWDPLFFDALAHYLAWVICFKITQSQEQKDQVFKDFRLVMRQARFVDSAEEPAKQLDIDVWMRSRVGPSQGFVRDPQT